ncbi:MAG: type IV pilus biogenesis/stability protein PilW [Gammaproteobacteria bacterium]|nr:MAG: type IV pilus biogenesis/stability protein PilW [Gammaproteobacteria bacterium]
MLLPALALVVAVGSGCISTTEGGFTEEASPTKAVEKRVALARQYIGEGNWAAAKRNLQLAYDIDPNNAGVLEAFALVYQSTGEYELAEESFKKAIKLDPGLSRARNNYAAFLFSQERYKEAEKQLDYVVKDTLYSARPRAFVNLGLCRQQLFDPQGAEEAFVRALAMDRTNRIALLEVAQIRFDAGDLKSASAYYDTYKRVAHQQPARGLWLGVRLARATGDRNAEGSYALALSNIYPDSAEYQAYLRTQRSD